MRRAFSALLVLVAGLVAVAQARDAAPRFIKSADVNVIALLPPPPVAGSDEATSELEVVLKLQASRTEAEMARAMSEARLTPAAYQSVFGERFTKENLPNLFALLEAAAADSRPFIETAKANFARRRPKFTDTRVHPIMKDDEPSHPSGHSTRGTLWATILCEIAPEKKDAHIRRGQEIGWDRVLAGMHFPSDIYAGRVLGQALAREMLKNADFQTRLAKAKEELAAIAKPRAADAPVPAGEH